MRFSVRIEQSATVLSAHGSFCAMSGYRVASTRAFGFLRVTAS